MALLLFQFQLLAERLSGVSLLLFFEFGGGGGWVGEEGLAGGGCRIAMPTG